MSRFSAWNNELVNDVQQLAYQPAARRTAVFAGSTLGFTIVELLIVIVVIGILAAIVITAYNGVQQRARNANVASVVLAYKKALLQYAADNHSYPISSGAACLGEDYPDITNYSTADGRDCFRSNSTTGKSSTTFNTALRLYMSNASRLPTPNNIPYGDGSTPWSTRGAIMHTSSAITINGVANPWVLIYTVEGQTKCPVGPALNLGAYPAVTETTPSSGYSQLLSGGTVGAECWILMPDPAKV